jgi:hypothetical protein
MEQRMWDNVVMFSFHEIYPISFVNKFNFVKYITRKCMHYKYSSVSTTWNEPIKKAYDQQIK